jgi:hypothetical protein
MIVCITCHKYCSMFL